MASIKFDNTEILNTTFIPRFIKHEGAPDRTLNAMELAREDGAVLISERYGQKRVALSGILIGTAAADLESKIDTFKELFSRPEKNLDISWNAGTRRYVATCLKHGFDRDHFHLLFVPWTAEFAVLTGEGIDTVTTKALDEHVVETTTPGSDSFTLLGSKAPKPKITLKGANSPAAGYGIEYKNSDTGERLVITRPGGLGTTDSLIIDCAARKVTDNFNRTSQREGIFYGVFPRFSLGTNNVLISVGGLVNQMSGESGIGDVGDAFTFLNTNIWVAQGFTVPYADSTFQGVVVALRKTGSPGNLDWRIETDNGGKPSGTLAHAEAYGTILAADVGASTAYLTAFSTNMWSLSANTKYWLVTKATSGDGSNYLNIGVLRGSLATYTRGRLSRTMDAGSTWSDLISGNYYNLSFKILYGGKPGLSSAKHTVEYSKTYL